MAKKAAKKDAMKDWPQRGLSPDGGMGSKAAKALRTLNQEQRKNAKALATELNKAIKVETTEVSNAALLVLLSDYSFDSLVKRADASKGSPVSITARREAWIVDQVSGDVGDLTKREYDEWMAEAKKAFPSGPRGRKKSTESTSHGDEV